MSVLTAHNLHSLLGPRPEAFVFDVREPDEFAAGRAAGTFNLPLSQIVERRFPEGNTPGFHDRIVLVCRSGKRTRVAADSLRLAGYVHVSVLEGGLLAWNEAGLPLVSDPSSTAPPRLLV